MDTRRNFLKTASSVALGASLAGTVAQGESKAPLNWGHSSPAETKSVSLNGVWDFRFDPDKVGESDGWYRPGVDPDGWQEVVVPHTWQIAQDSADHFGTAWYRRTLEVPQVWRDQSVRIEFEAVFHSATVWVNGTEVGKHLRKGYVVFRSAR